MRKYTVFLLMILFWHGDLFCQILLIESVKAKFNEQVSSSVQESTDAYLFRFINREASDKNLIIAKNFLESMYFVYRAECKYKKNEKNVHLECVINSKKTVKKIIVKNLPGFLLEKELKRKLPIQIGHLLDLREQSIAELLGVLKSRVSTFLKKNGYYGATIEVRDEVEKNSSEISFIIELKGGGYVRVNSVSIEGDTPINKNAIRKMYERMCFSFDRFFEALTMGTLRCYSRELERETTKTLGERLAEMGYLQSRVRVSRSWVDPDDKTQNPLCHGESPDDRWSKCVNLRVEISQGSQVKWSVNIMDNSSIKRNAFSRFLASLFQGDQLSRITASSFEEELQLDSSIIDEVVDEKITFISARNVDEFEIKESAKAIIRYLSSLGYINASVVPSFNQENDSSISVNFDVYTGKAYYLNSVRIEPVDFAKHITQEELDKIISIRSYLNSGHISYQGIDAALVELKDILSMRGFSDVNVSYDLQSQDNGAMDAVFYIKGSARTVISKIEIENGIYELNKDLLPILQNCDSNFYFNCEGSSLVRSAIDSDANKICEIYKNKGYLYALVRSELTEDKDKYKLKFHIFDSRFGPNIEKDLAVSSVKGMIISGNNQTKTAVIQRLFPSIKKDLDIDPDLLKKGVINLRSSSRFSKIDHKIVSVEPDSDEVYYMVQLAEKPSLFIDMGISFSTDQLLAVEMDLEESNFLSSMLTWKTTLGLGFFWGRQSNIDNKITWPFILGKPLRFSLIAPSIVYDDKSHLAKPFRRLQTKLGASIDWQTSVNVTPYVRYRLVHTQRDDAPVRVTLEESLKTLDGLIPTAKIKGDLRGVITPGFNYIRLDNLFNPRAGVDLDHWVEFSGGPFMGKPPFTNIGSQSRFFIPLGRSILAMRMNFMRSFIASGEYNWKQLGNGSSMQPLGGERSVRGYEEAEIQPDTTYVEDTTAQGYFTNNASIELRFPLRSEQSSSNLWGAAFVDQGLALSCSEIFKCKYVNSSTTKNLGLSLGIALRYILPVGPISLEYAISPIHKDTMRVHFILGYVF